MTNFKKLKKILGIAANRGEKYPRCMNLSCVRDRCPHGREKKNCCEWNLGHGVLSLPGSYFTCLVTRKPSNKEAIAPQVTPLSSPQTTSASPGRRRVTPRRCSPCPAARTPAGSGGGTGATSWSPGTQGAGAWRTRGNTAESSGATSWS